MRLVLLTTDGRDLLRDYAAGKPAFGTAPEALLQGFAQLPDLEVHVLSCARQPMPALERLAPNSYFHSLVVPKLGWMSTAYQGCIRAVRKQLKALQPDIVHGQGTERDCALSAAYSGFPNVLTIHGNMAELARVHQARFGSFSWLAARLEGIALQRTAGVLCNSKHTENLVRSRTRRTWLVPNPLRSAFFAEAPLRIQKPKCVLLNIGLICPNKRQNELIDLGERLRQAGLNFELHFAGALSQSSTYAAAFCQRVESAERQGWVRYHGVKLITELIGCIDQSSALIHVPMEEAFGLVVAEALARNLKLFGFRIGGIPDIADGAEGAELFDAGDWEGLRRGIEAWIRNGCVQPAAAGALMQRRFHPVEIARRHVEIYQEVLAAKAQRRG